MRNFLKFESQTNGALSVIQDPNLTKECMVFLEPMLYCNCDEYAHKKLPMVNFRCEHIAAADIAVYLGRIFSEKITGPQFVESISMS